MLILERKLNESILVGSDVVIEIVEVRGNKVRLGITAPRSIPVHRQEVVELIKSKQAEVTS
jgi:carbon storage regulator